METVGLTNKLDLVDARRYLRSIHVCGALSHFLLELEECADGIRALLLNLWCNVCPHNGDSFLPRLGDCELLKGVVVLQNRVDVWLIVSGVM